MISHAHPGSSTTGPDLIADQMRACKRRETQSDRAVAVVRIFALKCHRLRRCGFSFALAGHFLDVIVERHSTSGQGTTLIEHWSKAASAGGIHPAPDG